MYETKKGVRWSDAYTTLETTTKDFLNTVPLIQALGAKSMRLRHWGMLAATTKKQFTPPPEDPNLTLQVGGASYLMPVHLFALYLPFTLLFCCTTPRMPRHTMQGHARPCKAMQSHAMPRHATPCPVPSLYTAILLHYTTPRMPGAPRPPAP